ncbi:MAG: hypothetical protein ACI85O_003287 [Saprospiraceae bacterium]|jgi:hypothetical protein
MKKIQSTLLLLSFAFFMANSLNAQVIPAIDKSAKVMSMGAKSAFTVVYEGTDEKTVESQWGKIMKSYKGKVNKNKAKELFSDDVQLKDLSTNTVDVYATVSKDKSSDNTILSVWFDLGGAFLNEIDHPSQSVAVKSMIDQTSLRVGAARTEDVLEAEEDTLKNMNKDLEKMIKEKENGLKDIKDAKELIAKTEAMIKGNEKNQETKKVEIQGQEKTLEDAKSDRAKYPKL